MAQLKFTILAKDMIEGKYINSFDCPITKALQRAGYNMHDVGLGIDNGNGYTTWGRKVVDTTWGRKVVDGKNVDYISMMKKLSGMLIYVNKYYSFDIYKPIPTVPQDFDVVINY